MKPVLPVSNIECLTFDYREIRFRDMPRPTLSEGEIYHIYNRGVEKRMIFVDDHDRWRFITLLLLLQGESDTDKISRLVFLVQHRMLDKDVFKKVLNNRHIELIGFCLMPNHFHLILREIQEGGISKFMQRLLNAYTKYFNIRHRRSGHLFGGRFQAAHVDTNEYFLYLSAYLHLNSRELKGWRGREASYTWSSFQDFVAQNRWGNFLKPEIILEQFDSGKEYKKFVVETPIKTMQNNLDEDLLFD